VDGAASWTRQPATRSKGPERDNSLIASSVQLCCTTRRSSENCISDSSGPSATRRIYLRHALIPACASTPCRFHATRATRRRPRRGCGCAGGVACSTHPTPKLPRPGHAEGTGSGSATCALPCACTPLRTRGVQRAFGPGPTDAAVGAVYRLLLHVLGARPSLTTCCLPLLLPFAVWSPRSPLPDNGCRRKRQRRSAVGGLPSPVAVPWPPAGGRAAATANGIDGRAATSGGVPGSHHAGRCASFVCGDRTAAAAGTWSRGGGGR